MYRGDEHFINFYVQGVCRNAVKPASTLSGRAELGAQTLVIHA
jgi:hypothetical protein